MIDNMAPGDAGTYSCTAVNIAGRETKNVSVMIGCEYCCAVHRCALCADVATSSVVCVGFSTTP